MTVEGIGLVVVAVAVGPLLAWAVVKFLLAAGMDPCRVGADRPCGSYCRHVPDGPHWGAF